MCVCVCVCVLRQTYISCPYCVCLTVQYRPNNLYIHKITSILGYSNDMNGPDIIWRWHASQCKPLYI